MFRPFGTLRIMRIFHIELKFLSTLTGKFLQEILFLFTMLSSLLRVEKLGSAAFKHVPLASKLCRFSVTSRVEKLKGANVRERICGLAIIKRVASFTSPKLEASGFHGALQSLN